MANKRLFVDMDGTLAKFHDEANYLERMFEEGFFQNLQPFQNMVDGIKLFQQQHPDVEVFVISSCIDSPFCVQEKGTWLATHLDVPEDHRLFPPMGKPKSEVIPGGVTKDDYLLDDYNKGLNQFLYDGGSAIKCHNNINQQGLGAHGGSPGNLWVGDMVHTDDTPEMIAAELAQHMGLEYDLNKVVESYEDIVLTDDAKSVTDRPTIEAVENVYIARDPAAENFAHFFSNPLNAIRFLAGKDDFQEYKAKTYDGKEVSDPAFLLRAISTNLYNSPNFKTYLKADRSQFAEDVLKAREDAEHAMVGQIHYLDSNGNIGYSVLCRDMDAMKKEVSECQDSGCPIDVKWFIQPKVTPLYELKNYFELEERLYLEHGLEQSEAADIAEYLLIEPKARTPEQTIALFNAWNTYELPGSLQEFLGIGPEEFRKMLSAGERQPEGEHKPTPEGKGKFSLDSIIATARGKLAANPHQKDNQDPTR